MSHRLLFGLVVWVSAGGVAGAADVAADPPVIAIAPPAFPTPMQTSILGLALTAIAVIGARVSRRNSETMMYMVLASLAVTAVMVVYADRIYTGYHRSREGVLQQLQRGTAGGAPAAG